jgi:hypothetical protein
MHNLFTISTSTNQSIKEKYTSNKRTLLTNNTYSNSNQKNKLAL